MRGKEGDKEGIKNKIKEQYQNNIEQQEICTVLYRRWQIFLMWSSIKLSSKIKILTSFTDVKMSTAKTNKNKITCK